MEKGHEMATDIRLNTKGTDKATADFGGDLAKNEGIDLNAAQETMPSHREQFRGHVRDALYGGAVWVGENPVQAHDNPIVYGGKMAFGQRESLGQALYQYPAAQMEAAIDLHGTSPAVDANHRQITQELADHRATGISGDPLQDNESVYDEETGIDLTDERLQGYESFEDVPPEVLEENRATSDVDE